MASGGHRRGIQALTLVESLVAIAIMAILVAILVPTFNAQSEMGQQAKCAANLRSVCNAAFQFAADNNGILGGSSGTAGSSATGGRRYHWPTDYLPYMDRPDGASPAQMFTPTEAYLCPMNKSFKPTRAWHTHYAMNWLIGDARTYPWPKLQSIVRPSHTLLFMTGFQNDPNAYGWWLNQADKTKQIFPYKDNTLAMVAFADGHVKLMSREELNPPSGYTMDPTVPGVPWRYR